MKIILATGIYPPEIGGHSFYVESLKKSLEKLGHEVSVVLYGNLKKFPTGVRHFLYAIKLWRAARDKDAVIGFDAFSIAVPLGLIAPFLHIPVVERIGGDFTWEQHNARTEDFIPLPQFYRYTDRWRWKEWISFRLLRFALARLDIVFSSDWQRDLWRTPYRLEPAHISVIENAIPERLLPLPPERKNFMLYGRQIPLKNVERFRNAFHRAQKRYWDIELYEGAISREELLQKLRTGYAAALPSISDITPNYIIESIICGKPFLLTKYSAYAERFADFGVIVDPMSEDDIVRGIGELVEPSTYERLSKNIALFTEVRTYDDIAKEFIALLRAQ